MWTLVIVAYKGTARLAIASDNRIIWEPGAFFWPGQRDQAQRVVDSYNENRARARLIEASWERAAERVQLAAA